MSLDETVQSLKDRPVIYRSLSEATRRFPSFRNGRPVHTATTTRWIVTGVRLRNGAILKLRANRLPGRWVTTDEWIDEFVEALTLDRGGQATPPAPCPPSIRRQADERVEERLTQMGV